MAEEEKTSMQEEKFLKRKIKRHKIKKGLLFIVLFAFILVAAGVLLYIFKNKNYNSYTVVKAIKRKDSISSEYYKGDKFLYKYSRDGIFAMNQSGDILWSGAYNMNNPQIASCGNYTVVADIGGKDIMVYEADGTSRELNIMYTISKVQIANQGVTAVLAEQGDADHILIYNPFNNTKSLIYDFRTIAQKDGFPVDISLSKDGTKLVTSYLFVNNGEEQSTVTFYNLGEVGENKTNRITGAFPYKKSIVPRVEFINNNTVCVYKDNGFVLFQMKQLPEKICDIKFKENIKSSFSSTKYIGFVLENLSGEKKYKTVLYNLHGKKKLDIDIDYNYNKVLIEDEDILFHSDLDGHILRTNGQEKFHGTFEQKVSYFFSTGKINRYLLIDDQQIQRIKLSEDAKQ